MIFSNTISFLDLKPTSKDWERCWDSILTLPIEPLDLDFLYKKAERVVRACRLSAGDNGIDWFMWQIRDGQSFVAEQLVTDPDSAEWLRIHAVLSGAHAGAMSGIDAANLESV